MPRRSNPTAETPLDSRFIQIIICVAAIAFSVFCIYIQVVFTETPAGPVSLKDVALSWSISKSPLPLACEAVKIHIDPENATRMYVNTRGLDCVGGGTEFRLPRSWRIDGGLPTIGDYLHLDQFYRANPHLSGSNYFWVPNTHPPYWASWNKTTFLLSFEEEGGTDLPDVASEH